jgi:hypothetical protein
MGRITIRKHWKRSQAICTVASATSSCNSNVLHRQRKREGGQNGDRQRKREGGRAGDVEDKCKAGRAGDVEAKRKAGRDGGETSGLSRTAAARRRHGHDDDAFISPTTSIPGHASVLDRIDRAKGMTLRQAIRPKFYTTRSLKRDETAGYNRLVHSTGEGDPATCMCDAEGDGLESDRSPMDSDTDVGNPVDDPSD